MNSTPAYRDMDPYDLPDEFSHLQAQDMSKLGFMQDLIRGIKKLAAAAAEEARVAKLREKVVLLLLAGLAVVIAILLVVFQVIVPSARYRSAEKLLAAGDYTGAAMTFGALDGYKDAGQRSRMVWNEIAIRATISAGSAHTVGLKADGTVVAVGGNYSGRCDVSGWTGIKLPG